MGRISALLRMGLLTAVIGCTTVNTPINAPISAKNSDTLLSEVSRDDDGLFIGLAFSGGGTRATAFSWGMLDALRARTATPDNPNGVLEHVRLVSGVSGGSVTAAYFGLRGPRGLNGMRKFLYKDGETYMANSPYNPLTLVRGLTGGANSRNSFGRFVDEELFKGATFGDLARRSSIRTWINATDVANSVPFVFTPETFDALCSDLSRLPLSEAVSASAAFPLVFAPIVLESHRKTCTYREPDWLTSARFNPEASQAMRAHARALESYGDPNQAQFVKLLDGGITDNFGTTALSVLRARAQNPYGPLTQAEAVRMRRMLFLVADAGVEGERDWTKTLPGPGGPALAMSIANSSISAATRTGYDVFRLTLNNWHRDLLNYRCSLSKAEVKRLRGSLQGWDCKDLKLFVGQVTLASLDRATRAQVDVIPTRLRLERDQVDTTIAAAGKATNASPEFNGFLRSIGGVQIGAQTGGVAPRQITPTKN